MDYKRLSVDTLASIVGYDVSLLPPPQPSGDHYESDITINSRQVIISPSQKAAALTGNTMLVLYYNGIHWTVIPYGSLSGEGTLKTTTLIGRVCKRSDALS